MSVIFQPERILLTNQIKKFSSFIEGIILDVGCGRMNRYENYFTKKEKFLTLDINPNNKPDIVASADNIPLENNTVDSIVCTQVLEHLKNPTLAVAEFYRVLKNGGHVLITVPQWGELHEEPEDYYRFTNFGIKYILESAGFILVDIDKRGGFFSVVSQTNIRYLIDRFDLYHSWLSLFFSPLISLYGRFMLFLDKLDKSKSGRKHALGWCVVVKKQ